MVYVDISYSILEEMAFLKIDILMKSYRAKFCDFVIVQNRIFHRGRFTFFRIPQMMISKQRKHFCILHFSKTESVSSDFRELVSFQ